MSRLRLASGSRRRHLLAPLAFAGLLASCGGDSFDKTQVPTITVTPVVALPLVRFSWAPAGAQELRVYRGTIADGNAVNLVWAIAATGTNTLQSGVEYGDAPPRGGTTSLAAKTLILGQPYTVHISRRDPNGTGSDATSTQNRYSNVQTFTLATMTTPP